jgi:hypothetical protein
VTQLKLAATTLGIKKLEIGPNGGRVIFRPKPNVEPLTIIKMIQAQPCVCAGWAGQVAVQDAIGGDGGEVAGGE